jgi:integrase
MAIITSITQAELIKFKKVAKERQKFRCKKISGFFFINLKRGGAWRLGYTDLEGKRREPTIADGSIKPAEAAKIALEWRTKIKNGIDPLNEIEKLREQRKADKKNKDAEQFLNIGKFYESIYTPYKLDNFKDGKSTLQNISRNFSHLFDRDMDMVTSTDILSWYNKRRKSGVMRSSLVRDYGAFKAMLNFAAKSQDGHSPAILKNNPIKNYSLPALTLTEREKLEEHNTKLESKRVIMSNTLKLQIQNGLNLYAEQIKEKRKASRAHGKRHLSDLQERIYPHWFIPFCHIARLTGMRPADIYALKWENLAFNQFNNSTALIFTPSKTKKVNYSQKVTFPVSDELKAVFDTWKREQGSTTGFIFQSERTGLSLERKAHLTHWRQVKALGGITTELDLYSFRHNFISELCARGVPVLTIAKLVGHKDGSMIAANYLRHDETNTLAMLEGVGGINSTGNDQIKGVI